MSLHLGLRSYSSTSLTAGKQVDGLPPARNKTQVHRSLVGSQKKVDLFMIFEVFLVEVIRSFVTGEAVSIFPGKSMENTTLRCHHFSICKFKFTV